MLKGLNRISLFCALAFCVGPLVSAEQDEALALLHKARALMHGGGSDGTYRVSIVRPEWQRELRLRSIADAAKDRYRLEMLAPRKLKGTLFLKQNDRLSMYLPKLRREVAISPAMMHDAWMGSDFNNQDLLETSALIDHYQHKIVARDGDLITIESTPKADAAVSWVSLRQKIRKDGRPVEIRYHCQRAERARLLRFEQDKLMGGRMIPSRWIMQPLAKPDQHTLIEVEDVRFDIQADDALFQPMGGSKKQDG